MKPTQIIRLLLDSMDMHAFDRNALSRAIRNGRKAITVESLRYWTNSANKHAERVAASEERVAMFFLRLWEGVAA
ncbi:hypothetical protein [Roseimicrobium sp. ORNL1]|uniref:hypothetical protein n=1 Tax=Roseimicrobium sp. ORNL1 TaxID=2711231 RepID=UPI0013E10AA4|nr:hypothetical protein [Roseimicrobium sp. ORNL1]QIF02772.1 hypothetical protein G5S37_15000 [Roseimicrobium sp. ORNL1]